MNCSECDSCQKDYSNELEIQSDLMFYIQIKTYAIKEYDDGQIISKY